ncbi:hypothetical protein LZ31DRAFT_345676 [Colletotrichum somersetense]|nr:hypothetical protein LZ31DRAFT_345676 [Colletotrichum somersetense]
MEPTAYPRLGDEQVNRTRRRWIPIGRPSFTAPVWCPSDRELVRRRLQGRIHLCLMQCPSCFLLLWEQVPREIRVMRDTKRALRKSFDHVGPPGDVPTALTDSSHG